MKQTLATAVALLLICPATTLAAEDDGSQRMTVMDEVVVTATKTEEKRKDIPNSVVLADKYDLQESSARTIGEYLSGELGLDWRTYGNYGGFNPYSQMF